MLEGMLKNTEEWLKQQEIEQKAQEELLIELENMTDLALAEMGALQSEFIEQAFIRIVSEFYNSKIFTPKRYEREGDVGTHKGGLFDTLSIEYNEFGYVTPTDTWDQIYNPSDMHDGRAGENNPLPGESLFQLVFIEGWHGGAKGISKEKAKVWGKHPNPGTNGQAYYRRPGFVTIDNHKVWKRYGKWFKKGEPAVQEQNSPFQKMVWQLDAYWNVDRHWPNRFAKISAKYVKIACEKINTKYAGYVNFGGFGSNSAYLLLLKLGM